MERALKKAINSWLAAEHRGDARTAETALRRVFSRLPGYAPSAGFATVVCARLGIGRDALLAPPMSLRWKVVIGVCFALVAVAGGVLPGTIGALWTGLGPGKLIDLAAGALIGLSARLGDSLMVWGTLSGVARTVSESLASPTIMAAIAAAALVSVVALRLLHGLLIPERNSSYAQSH